MGNILVVDDDPLAATFLKTVLQEDGYQVRVAMDGQEALDMVAEAVPDLVVLDLDMPRMGGFEVCFRLKQAPSTRLLPILVLTALEPKEVRVPAWELGADEFLTKPAHHHDVLTRCRALLRVKRLTDELDSAEAVVFAFARAVEAKSSYTRGHADRVTNYALALAAQVGLANSDVEILRQGSVLHDIGKINLPDAILDKPGPLTEEEYSLVKQHPVQGVRILEPLRSVRVLLPLVRWHHERIDGCGYPDGLRGEAIPLLVRILSVADIYDAVSSDRPYREAMTQAQAIGILQHEAAHGGLDRDLVRRFCELQAGPPPAARSSKPSYIRALSTAS